MGKIHKLLLNSHFLWSSLVIMSTSWFTIYSGGGHEPPSAITKTIVKPLTLGNTLILPFGLDLGPNLSYAP